jgi:hypothetical protein
LLKDSQQATTPCKSTQNTTDDRPTIKMLEKLGQIIYLYEPSISISTSHSRAPGEHGPEPTLKPTRRPLRHAQVGSRDSEQEE